MERKFRNLQVEINPQSVVKSASPEAPRLIARLQNEACSLNLVSRHLPNRVPEVFSFSNDEKGGRIVMQKLELAKGVSFEQIIDLVEDLQTLPTNVPEIPTFMPFDYLTNAETKLELLTELGAFVGLSKTEAREIRRAYHLLLPSLEPFRTVFVHGDIQPRHFAKKGENLAILDFDQSHFGNELEDWAWIAIKQPSLSKKVISYLKEKFADNPEKLANLETAFLLMRIDLMLAACFNRTYQSRGRWYDVAAKTYGRKALRSLVKKAESLARNMKEKTESSTNIKV